MNKKPKSFHYESKLSIMTWMLHLLGYITGFPRTMTTVSSFDAVKEFDLNFFGLEEEKYNEIVSQHKKRYNFCLFFVTITFLLGILLSILLIFFFSLKPLNISLVSILNRNFNDLELAIVNIIEFIFTITILIFFWIGIELTYFRLIFRIIEFLIPKTMCLKQIINLNIELTRTDAISRPGVKQMILARMDYLARVTMLIPRSEYTTLGKTQWLDHKIQVERNFENIARYIYKRITWLTVPRETTLNDLRRDCCTLAYHYLTGTYGELTLDNFELSEQIVEKSRMQKIQGIFMTLSKVLVLVIPFIVGILCIIFRDKMPFFNDNFKNNLPYLVIGWFLIVVDTIYKLGIIESLTKLVTGLKDLFKK